MGTPVSALRAPPAPVRKQRVVDVAALPVIPRLSAAPLTADDLAQYQAVLRRCWIAVLESRAGAQDKALKGAER